MGILAACILFVAVFRLMRCVVRLIDNGKSNTHRIAEAYEGMNWTISKWREFSE